MKPLVSNLVAEKLSLQDLTDPYSGINTDCFGSTNVGFSFLQRKIQIVSNNAVTCRTSNIVTAFC